jgi:uncharacterized protein
MIHPDTKLKWISDDVGYGIVATKKIPKGTITFAQDPLDIAISPSSPLLKDKNIKPFVEKYSYINEKNDYVISWDIAKYMNHCCYANTLTTGWGFEVAVRDIEVGEEITDDYGLFTLKHDMKISCTKENCRGRVSIDDFNNLSSFWDDKISSAVKKLNEVDQPLIQFINDSILKQLNGYIMGTSPYLSVNETSMKSHESLNS